MVRFSNVVGGTKIVVDVLGRAAIGCNGGTKDRTRPRAVCRPSQELPVRLRETDIHRSRTGNFDVRYSPTAGNKDACT